MTKEYLKIPKRPILIIHPTKKIMILTIDKKIYGIHYDDTANKYFNTLIEYDEDLKTVINEYILQITTKHEDYNNKRAYEEIANQRTKKIIEELQICIQNKQSNGHFNQANSLQTATIKPILKEHAVKDEYISKLFKKKTIESKNQKVLKSHNNNKIDHNNIESDYKYILRQLIDGRRPTGELDKNGNEILEHVPRNNTLNEIGVILRKEIGLKQELEIKGMYIENIINDIYIKTKFNTMKKISFETLYQISLKLLHGTDNITLDTKTLLKRKDLKDILDYTPSNHRHYNILTLNNGLYDMEKHEFLDPEKIIERFGEPILTHKTAPFNYNPKAKGTKIKEVLRYAFDKYNLDYNPEIKEIKGFYEIGGYSLRSGNIEQKMAFMFGVANSSKSILNNLTTAIHDYRISSVPLEDYNKRFATSGLINSQLNSVRDINNAKVKDNSMVKIGCGNEPLPAEPKGKTRAVIPAIEVPFSIASGNVLLKFENPEPAVLRRLLHLEFKYRVPTAIKIDNEGNVIEWNEDDQWIIDDLKSKEKELGVKLHIPYVIKDIDKKIIDDNDEMEFLLYQFLEHDNIRINENNHVFSIEKSHDDILKDLELYSNPIETLLSNIIEYDETIKTENDEYETNENLGIAGNELFEVLREQAKINHVDIPKSNKSLGKKVTTAIRYLFDFDKTYKTKNSRQKLNLNNEPESCKQTKIYPKIKYKLLKTNKKHN